MFRKRFETSAEEIWREYMRPYIFLARKAPKIEVVKVSKNEFDFDAWLKNLRTQKREILRRIKTFREPGNFRRFFKVKDF